ncbi:MAG: DUF4230 domain-containing protein [Saprospiraceae bacterium]
MNYMFKNIFLILISVFVLGIGFWYVSEKLTSKRQAENSTIVLEKIKKVTKLITVEGYFSEIFDHKEYYKYDFLDLFTKKILLRVNAKVSVGYDFEKANITVDSVSKILYINEVPKPEVLSIDHEIDYYDISQGVFAEFTPEEYTKFNKEAKTLIESKVNKTDLFKEANAQKAEYFDMIEMVLHNFGWKLIIKDKNYISG